MFFTFDHAKVPTGALLQGGHSWRYVEYPTDFPWFHVALTEFDGAEYRSTTFHVYSAADLVELAESDTHQLRIERVLLVSPGYLNGTGNWQMDELLEIAKVELADRFSLVYRLRDFRTLFEDELARNADATKSHTVFISPAAVSMKSPSTPPKKTS